MTNQSSTRYTFEVEWPAPFDRGFTRTSRTFDSLDEASRELGIFLKFAFQNDVTLSGRLLALVSTSDTTGLVSSENPDGRS